MADKFIANKSFERYSKFKEGDEVIGIPVKQINVLELMGHVRREKTQAEALSGPLVRRRGRPTNAERVSQTNQVGAVTTRNIRSDSVE